jgi:hypothetical protein
MIWKLFKPKPVFVITFPNEGDMDTFKSAKEHLEQLMGSQYNIVIVFDKHKTYVETKILK